MSDELDYLYIISMGVMCVITLLFISVGAIL